MKMAIFFGPAKKHNEIFHTKVHLQLGRFFGSQTHIHHDLLFHFAIKFRFHQENDDAKSRSAGKWLNDNLDLFYVFFCVARAM